MTALVLLASVKYGSEGAGKGVAWAALRRSWEGKRMGCRVSILRCGIRVH
jgi:hypothetical protein